MDDQDGNRSARSGARTERLLLCPEDWEDPEDRKLICEYHMAGLNGLNDGAEVDVGPPAPSEWTRGIPRVLSSYHKAGAPYMDGDEEDVAPTEVGTSGPEGGGDAAPGKDGRSTSQARDTGPRPPGRPLNLATVELASYMLFRAIFGRGIRVPIRVPEGIDMDIVVRKRNILLNTNSFELLVPKLSVWHITYAYRGHPIIEMGRGVGDAVKIHWWNSLVLILTMWWTGRRTRRRLERAARDAKRQKTLLASHG